MSETDWVVDAHHKGTGQFLREMARAEDHHVAFQSFKYLVATDPTAAFKLRQRNMIALDSTLGHGR